MPGMVYDPAHASRASVRSFEWSGRELNGFQRVGVDTRPHDVAVLAAMRDVKDDRARLLSRARAASRG
jgi:hypothetical protein